MREPRKEDGRDPDEAATSEGNDPDDLVSTEAASNFFHAPIPTEDPPPPRPGWGGFPKPEVRAKLSQAGRFEVTHVPTDGDEQTIELPTNPPTPLPSPPSAPAPAPRPRRTSVSIDAAPAPSTVSLSGREPKTVRSRSRLPWVLASLVGMGGCFVLGTSLGVVVTWSWLWTVSDTVSEPPVAVVAEATDPPAAPIPAPPSVAASLPEPNQLRPEPPVEPDVVPRPTPVAAAPAPAPAPVPVPAPVKVAPAPVPAAPVKVAPAPVPAAPAPAPAGPRVESVAVTAEGATRTTLKCGGKVGTGAAEARLTQVPAGMCTIEVQLGGETHRMGFGVEAPTTMSCALVDGVLRCS